MKTFEALEGGALDSIPKHNETSTVVIKDITNINLGTNEEPKIIYISKELEETFNEKLGEFLKYKIH